MTRWQMDFIQSYIELAPDCKASLPLLNDSQLNDLFPLLSLQSMASQAARVQLKDPPSLQLRLPPVPDQSLVLR